MLQRYFSLLLAVLFFFSACQNSTQTETGEDGKTAMSQEQKLEEQKEANTSKMKTIKEAQKRQIEKTLEKVKKAKEDERDFEAKLSAEKRETLKAEKQKKGKLTKEDRISTSKKSTKERILHNLRKNKEQRDSRGEIGPSKDFIMGVRSLYDIDFKLLKLGRKAVPGYERYGEAEIIDQYYAYVSPDHIWGGPFMLKKGKEVDDKLLQEVNVYEAVLKSKEMVGGARPDIKITEIQFPHSEMAKAAIPKVKAISKAIYEYPKHINTFWQDEERIYIIETRAASFEKEYDKAHKVFYHTITSSK